MFTVKSVMTQLTDPELILQRMSDTLRKIDPKFVNEEQKYFCAVDALKEVIGDTVSPSASEYIAAREQQICAELIYVAWLGFQQNLECRERRMHTLPEVQKALEIRNAFYEVLRTLPEEKRRITEGITEYMSYLETTGYKLAHYFGFILADEFLHHVVPGYVSDSVATMQYRWDLQKYLQLDLKVLE